MSFYIYFGVALPMSRFQVPGTSLPVCPRGHDSPVNGALFCGTCGSRLEVRTQYDFRSISLKLQEEYENTECIDDFVLENGLEVHQVGYHVSKILIGMWVQDRDLNTEGSEFQTYPAEFIKFQKIADQLQVLFPNESPKLHFQNH